MDDLRIYDKDSKETEVVYVVNESQQWWRRKFIGGGSGDSGDE